MNGLPARNPDRMRKPTTAARSSAAWVPVTPCRHSSVQSAMPAESTPTAMAPHPKITSTLATTRVKRSFTGAPASDSRGGTLRAF